MKGAKLTTKTDDQDLVRRNCVPCRGDTLPLTGEAIQRLLKEVVAWKVVREHHLVKRFRFKDFTTALDFVNRVGELSEQEWHHPDLSLAWGRVDIKIYTHKIDALSDNDFILAAKIDHIYQEALG